MCIARPLIESLCQQYCVNQGQGSKVLQSLRQSNISLSEHLDRIRNEDSSIRSLDLSSFLLIPSKSECQAWMMTEDLQLVESQCNV